MSDAKKADITEVFSSIQGEGMFMGAKQIFVRFKKCNMNCAFCDVPKEMRSKEYSSNELMAEIKILERAKGPHHSVSLTGGEPLMYAEFLKEFLMLLKTERIKCYLETNGTLPKELFKLLDLADIIAMDFKLPSSTGGRGYWDEHLEFLKIAKRRKVFVKAVVTANTKDEDISTAASLIRKVDDKLPFILQPVTPLRSSDKRPDNKTLLRFFKTALYNKLENVRVIPQIHKILNVR